MVYLIGSLVARPVKIGTSTDVATRVKDLQRGSPAPLHAMWQTRGELRLERALHGWFASYRTYGEWFDFRDDHPVALVATAAVNLGYRQYPSGEMRDDFSLPSAPQLAEAHRLAGQIREAFARAGDPPAMPFSEVLSYLQLKDPDAWGNGTHDRTAWPWLAGRLPVSFESPKWTWGPPVSKAFLDVPPATALNRFFARCGS
ncbi:GIY-YIG nuclease family protein [Streptomyces decoyicus]|uniref:GIY-YIG nuclease family protein n=1 Tax=Streptomyces decoyicus TaxID=249567 RepID=UPI0039A49649